MKLRLSSIITAFGILLISCNTTVDPPAEAIRHRMGTNQRALPDTLLFLPEISPLEQYLIDSGLLDVQALNANILVDLKYSGEDNFMKADVYGAIEKCYLRPLAAEKLAVAAEILQKEWPDLRLLVFDGARPRRIQKMMWDTLNIPFKRNYLANPWEGSIHNYGLAVDLTIADQTGKQLDMGTEFDHFGKLAQPQLEAELFRKGLLTELQLQNRKLLSQIMQKAGFYPIKTEWWHFNALPSAYVKAHYFIIE